MIIFLHIPKTSGTTIMRRIVPNNVICGHYPYGIHKYVKMFGITSEKFQYFTFLRNPIRRWNSHYNYILSANNVKYKNSPLSKTIKSHNSNMLMDKGWLCNNMTKQLSGLGDFNDRFYTNETLLSLNIYNPFSCFIHDNIDMAKAFKIAKENIKKFSFVGFVENTPNDYYRLCEQFGWSAPKIIPHLRETKYSCIINPKLITEMNRYDFELYNWAKDLFWKK